MRELGRAADEDPQVTADLLQVYADVDQGHKELGTLSERVSGMRRDLARYTEEVKSLTGRVAPDLVAADPFMIGSGIAPEGPADGGTGKAA